MEWEFELVAGPFDHLTEGPAWDGQALLFTHIPQSRIMRYDPQTGVCTEYRMGTHGTNGLAFDAEGRLYGCCGEDRSIVRFEADGRITVIVDRLDGRRINTPNDLAVDRLGRVWFTNPWNESLMDPSERMEQDYEEVLRADPQPDGSWSLKRMTYDAPMRNGILVSPDQRTLYVAQSHTVAGMSREPQGIPHSGGWLPGRIHGATPVRRGLSGTPAGNRRHVFRLRRQHRCRRRLEEERPRAHDLRHRAIGSRSGNPPNARGRGRAHQLHLWGCRPAHPLHDHSGRPPLSGQQYRAPGLAYLATSRVARSCPFPLDRLTGVGKICRGQ